jgi:very-short-patch-repair endonuclease
VDVYRALQEQNLVFTPLCWIVHQNRRRYRTDFMIYYEGRAYALEIDGHDWHKSKDQRAYDAARDRFFDMRGIATIRFTASEVHNKLQQCMFELIDCLTKTRGRQV